MAQTPRMIEVNAVAAMPRCRDCRWWVGPFELATGGICSLANNNANRPLDEAGRPRFSKATAIGPEGRGPAALVTAPDFGCVQFEARG
jgi:hypothetical protein